MEMLKTRWPTSVSRTAAGARSLIVWPIWPNLDGRPSSLSPMARLEIRRARSLQQVRIANPPSSANKPLN
jgi:hypothetical protein